MTGMLSVALAVAVTAGLALAVADHLGERVEHAGSRASASASGLGLESVGGAHAILHGTLGNTGNVALRLASVSVAGPAAPACAGGACELELALSRADGTACAVGRAGEACTLLPGEVIDLGPSVHALRVTPRERYVVMLSAEASGGGSVSIARGVAAR